MARRPPRAPTVVITGGSSGLGRATAREFARRGWNVALIARGPRSLESAAQEVETAGGRALVLPLDVADAEAVEDAADRVVREFGGIDVWINGAAVAEYAPLHEITPDEFRRITDVNYLGSVYGIRAALKHMRPRDRGHIIQVGSVLSQRAIPLQTAYCGSKYGIRGVLDALNAELRHDRSRVRTTIVQPPGMNTPFFDHARNRMPRRPMPTPPIYEPEVTARAIWRAVQEQPRELWVGGLTAVQSVGHVLAPGLMDRVAGRVGYVGQQSPERRTPGEPDNLFESVDDGGRTHGRFGGQSLDEGSVVEPLRVRWMLGLAGASAIAALTALALRSRRAGASSTTGLGRTGTGERAQAGGDGVPAGIGRKASGGASFADRSVVSQPDVGTTPNAARPGMSESGSQGVPGRAGMAGSDPTLDPEASREAAERSVQRAFRNTSPDLPTG
jgi:NAD(P)-dependent dehydrogenase (short-subunit alcohol dehydrogenase family)/predicted outer membrane lipoprotein